MAKVIIQYPYVLSKELKKQICEEIKKKWDEGLLVLDGLCKVIISNDTDVIIVEFKEE